MVVVLKTGVTDEQVAEVKGFLEAQGYDVHHSQGVERTILGGVGYVKVDEQLLKEQLVGFPQVDDAIVVVKPYKLVNRDFHQEKTVIDVDGVKIGGPQV